MAAAMTLLVALALVPFSSPFSSPAAFLPPRVALAPRMPVATHMNPLGMSSSSSSSEGGLGPSSSGYGNRVPPTDDNVKLMDDMITKMAAAPPYELPGAVSRAIKVCSSPSFFLRIAERVDMESEEDKKVSRARSRSFALHHLSLSLSIYIYIYIYIHIYI